MQYTFFVFVFFLSSTDAVLQPNPYGTTVHETTKLVDPRYPIKILLSLFPIRPAKQPLSREINTLHQVYPINCTDICTLLSTRLWSNDFCAPRRNTCTGDMFLMGPYLHHLDIDGATAFARHGASPALTIYF